MSECTHDCSSCGENCAEREMKPEDFLVKLSQGSSVKKVIGVVSGKGGVGKSMVTSLLAAASMREGFKTAILDGDITGPSIPKAFGLSINLVGNADGLILPATTTCVGFFAGDESAGFFRQVGNGMGCHCLKVFFFKLYLHD